MPRACTVCASPERAAIDRALVSGEPVRAIASRYGTVGRMALQRHKEDHLPETLARARAAQEVALADDLRAAVLQLRDRAYGILGKAEASGDLRTALAGVREARGCLELLAEMEGELDRRPQVNVLVMQEWQALRSRLFAALEPYPEARLAIAEALQHADP